MPLKDAKPGGMTVEETQAIMNHPDWDGELWQFEELDKLLDKAMRTKYSFGRRKGAKKTKELLRKCDYFLLVALLEEKAELWSSF